MIQNNLSLSESSTFSFLKALHDKGSVNRDASRSWKKLLLIIGLAPLFHVVMTWDLGGGISQINQWFRLYSLPVVLLETFVLLVARAKGWNPFIQYQVLPRVWQLVIIMAVISAYLTSLAISSDPFTSVIFATKYVLHGLLLAALVFVIAEEISFSFDQWISVIIISGLGYVLAIVVFCMMVADPSKFRWIERLPSATNVRQIGNVVGIMVLAPTTMLLFSRSRLTNLMAVLAITVLLTFVMWSGTRAALLAFLLAIGFATFFKKGAISLSKFSLLAVAVLCAVIVSLSLPSPAPGFGLIRISESLSSNDPSSGRLQMWIDAITAIIDAPLIGRGAGMYRENMAALNGYPYNHPHNFILQFLYDWGMIGGGLALALVSWLGHAILTKIEPQPIRHFLALGVYTSLISMALVEGTLFHPLPMLLAAALISPHLAFRKPQII